MAIARLRRRPMFREKTGGGGAEVSGVSYNHGLVTILQAMGPSDNTFGNPDYGQGPIPGLLSNS